MDQTQHTPNHGQHHVSRLTYFYVFLALAVITAVEIGLAGAGLARGLLNTLFMLLSLLKAGLVAAFYMHLKQDSRSYTYIFVLPAILLAVFAILATLA